jgi:hypothetical protein
MPFSHDHVHALPLDLGTELAQPVELTLQRASIEPRTRCQPRASMRFIGHHEVKRRHNKLLLCGRHDRG